LPEILALMNLPGEYGPEAASYLMKLLYGARMCCPWLTVPVQRLAAHVHSWNAECDRRLVRLYDFVWSNLDIVLSGVLSEADIPHLELHYWPDADLNGDMMHTKSTGGMFVELLGLNGRGMPIGYASRKQAGTALHTPEAETVSLATFLRNEILPMQGLLSILLQRPVKLVTHEDNTSTIAIIKKRLLAFASVLASDPAPVAWSYA
jgi:hypothetical protein